MLTLFFFIFIIIIFLFNKDILFINEEFIIFISLLIFFIFLTSLIKSSINNFFFKKIQSIFFVFLKLVNLQLELIENLIEYLKIIKLKLTFLDSTEFSYFFNLNLHLNLFKIYFFKNFVITILNLLLQKKNKILNKIYSIYLFLEINKFNLLLQK